MTGVSADRDWGDPDHHGPTICVVGSGTAFLSGISYYTHELAVALSERFPVCVVRLRYLIPRRFYPGRHRVGHALADLSTSDHAAVFDGVDWYLLPSLARMVRFLRRQEPNVYLLQWWTSAALPAYTVIYLLARANGAVIVLEFHEDLDSGEARLPFFGRFLWMCVRHLAKRADGYIMHSAWDRQRIAGSLDLPPRPTAVIRHGPYAVSPVDSPTADIGTAEDCTILFFGTIRPYKGLEVLIDAFDRLAREEPWRWHLLVVGEPWEGWDLPLQMIRNSPHRSRIELVDRYVTDAEVSGYFARADMVALPYYRSSASGPLHVAMACGLRVVVTDVGGLGEAVKDYSGAVTVEARSAESLVSGIRKAATLPPGPHVDSRTWADTARDVHALIREIEQHSSRHRQQRKSL